MHKVGDLLKVKDNNVPIVHLYYEEFPSGIIGSEEFNEGDHLRISKIQNDYIYMKRSDGEIFFIKEKDIDYFLINVRCQRKDKLEQIFNK